MSRGLGDVYKRQVLGINLNNIYEPNNDPTADTFDNNKERFKTLYGKKYICEEKL